MEQILNVMLVFLRGLFYRIIISFPLFHYTPPLCALKIKPAQTGKGNRLFGSEPRAE